MCCDMGKHSHPGNNRLKMNSTSVGDIVNPNADCGWMPASHCNERSGNQAGYQARQKRLIDERKTNMTMPQAMIAALVLVASLPGPAAAATDTIPLNEITEIHGLGFDPGDPGKFFIATHMGVYKGGPDGRAVKVSTDNNDYMGFTVDVASKDRLLASGHPPTGGGLGITLSSDKGASWTQIGTGVGGPVDFHAMTVSPADPQTLYGTSGGIQVSRDGGVTWSMAGPGPDRLIDLAASAKKAEAVYAATLNGLMQSADAGATWQLLGPPNAQVTMVETAPDGSLYAFFAGSGLFRQSPDTGTWDALATDFGAKYVLHLAADPADPAHLLAATQEAEILESKDGGKTWTPAAS